VNHHYDDVDRRRDSSSSYRSLRTMFGYWNYAPKARDSHHRLFSSSISLSSYRSCCRRWDLRIPVGFADSTIPILSVNSCCSLSPSVPDSPPKRRVSRGRRCCSRSFVSMPPTIPKIRRIHEIVVPSRVIPVTMTTLSTRGIVVAVVAATPENDAIRDQIRPCRSPLPFPYRRRHRSQNYAMFANCAISAIGYYSCVFVSYRSSFRCDERTPSTGHPVSWIVVSSGSCCCCRDGPVPSASDHHRHHHHRSCTCWCFSYYLHVHRHRDHLRQYSRDVHASLNTEHY